MSSRRSSRPAPAALEDLVITSSDLGPLAVGAPVPAQPRPSDVIRWDPLMCDGTAEPARWAAAYPEAPDLSGNPSWPFTVWEDGGRVVRLDVLVPGPHTSGSIEVGSTLAELQAAHPQATRHAPPAPGEALDLWGWSDSSGTLVFEVSADATLTDEPAGTILSVVILAPDHPYGSPADYPLGYAPAFGGDVCS